MDNKYEKGQVYHYKDSYNIFNFIFVVNDLREGNYIYFKILKQMGKQYISELEFHKTSVIGERSKIISSYIKIPHILYG